MKVFLSYSQKDKEVAKEIAEKLSANKHEVLIDDLKIRAGDNWLKKIDEFLKNADVIIPIISKNLLNSDFDLQEIQSIAINNITSKGTKVIPVKIDESPIPGYLSYYPFLDLSKNFATQLEYLSVSLTENKIETRKKKIDNKRRNKQFIEDLSKALKEGKLTLVCGAGVSIGAGIPSWNDLLLRLLESMMNKMSQNEIISLKGISPNEIHKRLGPSALVMGKYLKSNLGKDFLPELRDALYEDNPTTCNIIEAIVEVSRPQRDGKPLDSIITFNFDGLVEENLESANIKHKAINKGGIRNNASELPVYHVHGYLPRKGKLDIDNEIVFSEDAYHTQFLDPYSWSNLIQLNKLSQNVCLFIGLSLSDPNMRRLLDVAIRKDPTKKLNHYIIKKVPDFQGVNSNIEDLMIFLEEQDANELGLNVIWIDNFDEIPQILNQFIA